MFCALFGFSKQAYYKKIKADKQKKQASEAAQRSVLELRTKMPRLGTRKLHHLLKSNGISIGRDKLFCWLRSQGLLVYNKSDIPLQRTQNIGCGNILILLKAL